MTIRPLHHLGIACLVLLSLAASASGYYHYIHYAGRSAPFQPIQEKFDLSALFNKTVYVYVPDIGPTQYAAGDSLPALLSELRFAARAWNDVDTSDLRVAFGGLFSPGTPASTPHIEVSFDDDIPPGLLAQGGVTSRSDFVSVGANGPFVAISASLLRLPRDMSSNPSFSPQFLLTAIHEVGHTLGLQHSMVSATMSTSPTRATTKARPLAADDIAGISLLYPNSRFSGRFGSISGQVTMSGSGVSLASVVAVTAGGDGVNTLTNPDGTYRIDGLPPGQYSVYVQPLPPAAQQGMGPGDLVLPVGPDKRPFGAGGLFQAQFFPGTQDPQQAATINVSAGSLVPNLNFSVRQRDALALYNVTTYSFPGSVAVQPAFVNINYPARSFLVGWGPGLVVNNAPAPGLNVSVLGSTTLVTGVQPYMDPNYAQILFMFHPFSTVGPRHLVFSLNGDMYVLPSGLNVVNRQPPTINSITPDVDAGGNRVAVITGTNLTADTRILFDGLPAGVSSFDDANQRIVVTPPPGGPGYRANVVALNPDGQTSQFLQAPAGYQYDPAAPPAIALQTTALAAGAESMIEIAGSNTNFSDGLTRVGFGSSDLSVKRVWVMSPTRLRVEVVAAPNAALTSTQVSVISGFQVINQPFAFQITPGNPAAVGLGSDLVNAATGQPGAYPGLTVAVPVTNLPAGASGLTLTLNDIPVPIVSTGQNQITFQVPATQAPGYGVLRLQTGGDPVPPVIVSIDAAPPTVAGVFAAGVALDANHSARGGDLLLIIAGNLADPGTTVAPNRLNVNIGGVDHVPMGSALPVPALAGMHQLLVILSPAVPAGQPALTVSVDGRGSQPFALNVRGQ